jgi:hypothetical protein
MNKMRVSHWWCALLLLGCAQTACADEAATDDASSMEIIEMLGEIDDDTGDLEIAMSDENWDENRVAQEVKNAE